MSNGEKKPGVKDISDLKARLSSLNKGAKPVGPAGGASSAFGAPLDDQSDASIGAATAVVRIEPQASASAFGNEDQTEAIPMPSPEVFTAPAPAPAPIAGPRTLPGPPSGAPPGGLNLGADLFKRPEPEPAPAAPLQQQSTGVKPLISAVQAERKERLANPLASAPISVALSAADEAALNSVENKAKGVKPSLLVAVAGVTMAVTAFVAFGVGSNLKDNELIKYRKVEAANVRDRVTPLITQMEELANLIERMDPRKVDWQTVSALPETLPGVDAGGILTTRVPLPAEITGDMGRAVADIDRLFKLTLEHRKFTLNRDRAELEALEKGDSWSNNLYFAAYFQPVDAKTPPLRYIPPDASMVAVVGKPRPSDDGQTNVVQVKFRSGETRDVPVQHIVLVKKGELLESGSANVLALYSKRVEELRMLVGSIRQYGKGLRDKLNAEANRP